jgi:hypothetical protein
MERWLTRHCALALKGNRQTISARISCADVQAGQWPPARRLFGIFCATRGIKRKWHDFTGPGARVADLGRALFIHLINADDRMQRDIGTGDIVEFGLQRLLGGVYNNGRFFTKNQLLDLDKTVHIPLMDIPGINLEDFALVKKDNLVNRFPGHMTLFLQKVT